MSRRDGTWGEGISVLTLSLAAVGLAATTILVTAGSRPEPLPSEVPVRTCQDLRTGAIHVPRTGRCPAKVHVEIAQGRGRA